MKFTVLIMFLEVLLMWTILSLFKNFFIYFLFLAVLGLLAEWAFL